jgi:hypothetical protein
MSKSDIEAAVQRISEQVHSQSADAKFVCQNLLSSNWTELTLE